MKTRVNAEGSLALRTVEPELLDQLAADDPRAMRSRRDLQRLNALMGNARIVARQFRREMLPPVRRKPDTTYEIVELGAGDGTLLLKIARRLHIHHSPREPAVVRATLVDRRPIVTWKTVASFRQVGWAAEPVAADVFEWLKRDDAADAIVANLFLHHFGDVELRELMVAIAQRANTLIACEPRRARLALAGASTLRVIGCSDVTVHDAKISVRAGFRDRELSNLWPGDPGWKLTERRAGPFTHLFVAHRL